MPIRDYIVYPDHFEPQGLADIAYRVISEFAFPCCVCVHNDKKQTQRPCNKCGHNVNQLSESNAALEPARKEG